MAVLVTILTPLFDHKKSVGERGGGLPSQQGQAQGPHFRASSSPCPYSAMLPSLFCQQMNRTTIFPKTLRTPFTYAILGLE